MNFKISLCIIYLLSSLIVQAQITPPLNSQNLPGANGGSEYYVGQSLGKPLITVNLISGVARPGVYYIPENTNISELLAYAGGSHPSANLDEILIRHHGEESISVSEVDLNNLMQNKMPFPKINDKDTIVIPQEDSFNKTVRWTSFTATIISIVSAIMVLQNNSK